MLPLARRLEALLFISPRPLAATGWRRPCACSLEDAAAALEALRAVYAVGAHGIEVREVAGGFTFAVAGRLRGGRAPAHRRREADDLTPALLETLAVVAYLEPVTRAEIAEIRGVSSEWALGGLEERGLVEQQGRADTPGAPILYGTGDRFLKLFGLASRADLPPLEEFALGAGEVEEIRARLHANAERRAQ